MQSHSFPTHDFSLLCFLKASFPFKTSLVPCVQGSHWTELVAVSKGLSLLWKRLWLSPNLMCMHDLTASAGQEFRHRWILLVEVGEASVEVLGWAELSSGGLTGEESMPKLRRVTVRFCCLVAVGLRSHHLAGYHPEATFCFSGPSSAHMASQHDHRLLQRQQQRKSLERVC